MSKFFFIVVILALLAVVVYANVNEAFDDDDVITKSHLNASSDDDNNNRSSQNDFYNDDYGVGRTTVTSDDLTRGDFSTGGIDDGDSSDSGKLILSVVCLMAVAILSFFSL
eukprot:TRINITY_DN40890_c1_g2_i1.p1 TRINITY_DN40890_c1_g2~~TRINITY_DN40890_c1_g2_i1.p1  ORF type:complete len:129 (-),score=16.36 TRINITY_DN40890_c1_g2_i1:102-434(-)